MSVGPMVRRPGGADHCRVTFDPACLCARTGRHRLVIFAGANRGGREEAMANADVQRICGVPTLANSDPHSTTQHCSR